MLNDYQITRLWDNLLAAESRSLYFGDLASRYTRRKQVITGLSFFFSSGAAATIIARLSEYIPILLSLAVAASTAYSIAVGLDRKIATMAKLHSAWKGIAFDYERLWNNTYADDADSELQRIIKSEVEPAELAATDAPNDQELLGKWQEKVFSLYHATAQDA